MSAAFRETLDSQGGSLDDSIARARSALLADQHADGHWCYELEADCTIPAEYIMMMHYLDNIDSTLERKIAVYLRAHQAAHGGWPLYTGGDFDLSCSVKAYYALKLMGDSPQAPHMQRARAAILARGGAAKANVFTRIALAIFEQLPWRGVPYIPVEIMLLPKWFPFNLSKVAYWSRTVMVPLFVLCTKKARAANPRKVNIAELFVTPPDKEHHYFSLKGPLNRMFLLLDRMGRAIDALIPKTMRTAATKRAEGWIIERRNGEGGLGAIFPAMVNAYEALLLLGYPADHEYCLTARKAIDKLLIIGDESAYCQPCVSPVWDTGLACLALQEEVQGLGGEPAVESLDWLKNCQLLDEPGDWQVNHAGLPGGGWAFQYTNPHYPDLDDTAVIVWAMHQAQDTARFGGSIKRAADWIRGMQSKNGGFAAFDSDNTHYYLNHIPFADHGALLDPPSSDVSARCLMALAVLNDASDQALIRRCVDYLLQEQSEDGAWFGRWGSNYIYGTWSVLVALAQVGLASDHAAIRKAVKWLHKVQRSDGGWGETNDSYQEPQLAGREEHSTSFHTAWALLALLSAGETASESLSRGVDHLMQTQNTDGYWDDIWFNAPGFPRVFYLRYHGYRRFFPLWALAKYRNLNRLQ